MDAIYSRDFFMQQAMIEARKAGESGEVPIGAVIVVENRIIARAHNLTETLQDTTAHAEMLALTAAFDFLHSKYLRQCTMYVTLEPCTMCAGALAWSQIGELVYSTPDPKKGYSLFTPGLLHPSTKVTSGLLATENGEMITDFFRKHRT
jgi:tRNA(adenine34) deaminase